MARRRSSPSPTLEETDSNRTSHRRRANIDLVRIDNRPFESPRGRGRNNPGWGRIDNLPFVSPRGRGRRIPLPTQSQHSDSTRSVNYAHTSSDLFHPEDDQSDLGRVQPFTAPDGTLYYSGLRRLDNKPFESPRGRGRNRPNRERNDSRPIISHHGHQRQSEDAYAPSAPTYEDILDVDN